MAKIQAESLKVANPMVNFLRARGWTCVNMVAGFTTNGLADYWCFHEHWGERWIEFKRLNKYGQFISHLTDAQSINFPIQYKAGVKLYCIADYDLRGAKGYRKRKEHYRRLLRCEPNIMDLIKKRRRHHLWIP